MDNLTEAFKNSRVLVIGDIMLDRYYWRKVRRISPEVLVPVVKMRRITETLGGVGNVANNLAGLGCVVTVVGLCGNDQAADRLCQIFKEKKIDDGLITDPKRPTTTKTRIKAHKQQFSQLDEEAVRALPSDILEQVRARINCEIPRSQAVFISDYGKGIFTDHGFTQDIIQSAHSLKIPVLVDPKGTVPPSGPTTIKALRIWPAKLSAFVSLKSV